MTIYKLCKYCNKLHPVRRCEINRSKYCNNLCRALGRRKRIKKICEVCKTKFEVIKCESWIRCCTPKCGYKIRKDGRIKQGIWKVCPECKENFYVYKSHIPWRKCCSTKCMGLARTGNKSYCWEGGVSFEPYPISFNSQLKKLIKERDNYCCKLCDKNENDLNKKGSILHIHHLDYNKENIMQKNLICLCEKCHGKTNHDRNYWQQLLQNKLKNYIIMSIKI